MASVAVYLDAIGHITTYKNVDTATITYNPFSFKTEAGTKVVIGGRFSYLVEMENY